MCKISYFLEKKTFFIKGNHPLWVPEQALSNGGYRDPCLLILCLCQIYRTYEYDKKCLELNKSTY